jgi:hypothetical protein
MNKPVILAALTLICLNSASSFVPTQFISTDVNTKQGFAAGINTRHSPWQCAKSPSLLTLQCSDSTRISRRILLSTPFVLPLVASAFDQDSRSTSTPPAKDEVQKGQEQSSKSATETKSDKGSEKQGNDSTGLAMKECDTPAKPETKKQEICEVDY